jgi:hypothetical protein
MPEQQWRESEVEMTDEELDRVVGGLAEQPCLEFEEPL